MPAALATRTLDPSRLSDAERQEFAREFLDLCRSVFDGPGVDALAQGTASGALGETRVCCYYAADRLVGFTSVYIDEFDRAGEPTTVLRVCAGLLPEHRGQQRILGFLLALLLRYAIENPRRKMYFFGPILDISSFRVIARHAPAMYPHPTRSLPDSAADLIAQLAARYRCEPVAGAHPLVCRRPLRVRRDRPAPLRAREPDALDHLFHGINPRSAEGHCLMVLVPVSFAVLAQSGARYALTLAERRLRPAPPPRPRSLEAA